MRVIFEEVDGEYFFEIILGNCDLDKIILSEGITGDYLFEYDSVKTINVFLRKENKNIKKIFVKK